MLDYPPHGACWLWSKTLILLHSVPDLSTFIGYVSIPAIAYSIYRRGNLSKIKELFPNLWRAGIGFVFFCGLSHLGNFIEVFYGGWVYYATGINKLVMGAVTVSFAYRFYCSIDEIVLICLVLSNALSMEEEKKS